MTSLPFPQLLFRRLQQVIGCDGTGFSRWWRMGEVKVAWVQCQDPDCSRQAIWMCPSTQPDLLLVGTCWMAAADGVIPDAPVVNNRTTSSSVTTNISREDGKKHRGTGGRYQRSGQVLFWEQDYHNHLWRDRGGMGIIMIITKIYNLNFQYEVSIFLFF